MDRSRRTSNQNRASRPRSKRTDNQRASAQSRRPPPVISRTGIGMNTAAADRPLPRRRVDVPLSVPGAEIRLPAVPIVNNKWRVVSGVISAVFLMLLVMMLNSDFFKVEQIAIEGLERYQEAEIIRAAGITGAPVFSVNPEVIREDLMITYTGLNEVEVEVGWPNQVKILLEERAPALAWSWDGNIRWIDKNGIAFEPHGEPVGVSTVKSSSLPPTIDNRFVDPRIIEAVQALAGGVPEGAEILFDEKHGLGWKDPRGWLVYFGFKDDDAAQKLIAYQGIAEYLEGKGITPAVINIEYLESPYFRMEQ